MPQDQGPPSRVVCFGETMAQLVPDDGLPLNTAARFTVRTAGAEPTSTPPWPFSRRSCTCPE